MLYLSTTNPPTFGLLHTHCPPAHLENKPVEIILPCSAISILHFDLTYSGSLCRIAKCYIFQSLFAYPSVSQNISPHFRITSEQVRRARPWSESGKVSVQWHRTHSWAARSYMEPPEQPANLHQALLAAPTNSFAPFSPKTTPPCWPAPKTVNSFCDRNLQVSRKLTS